MAEKDTKQDSKPQAKPVEERAEPGVYIVNGQRVDANGKPAKGEK